MGNQEIIDSVVDPVAIQQFNDLKAASAAATEQMVIATKAAIALNNATGGSQSFSVFKKNAEQANIAVNTIIVNSEKVKIAEDKARAYKADMDEKAMNKYLILLSKQEAARQTQDAKQIAAAQSKADKLAQIDAERAAKRKAQLDESNFPNNPSPTPLVAQEPSEPSARYTPIITGNEDMSSSYRNQTTGIQGETVALTEQEAALRKNIELHLELQAELAAIKGEQKLVNTETASGAQQMIGLKQRELETNAAISQNKSVLNQQTKEIINQQGSNVQLNASLAKLRLAYDQLSVAEKENVEIGGKMLLEINALDAETKKQALSQGVTNKEVGAYEKAIAKATNASQLAATGVQVLTRSLIRMVVQFALFGVAFEAISALYEYIKALNIFNPIASQAETRQKALTDAFNSADYTKAIESTEKLAANLDLAKGGFADSDTVINEYNETIGKTFGYVNNLNDAQKGFIENSDKYIKAAYLEAAAQLVLADSSKFAAETAQKNQLLRTHIAQLEQEEGAIIANSSKNTAESTRNLLRQVENMKQGEINEVITNNKRADESYKNSLETIKQFYKDKGKLTSDGGKQYGADPTAELANRIANAQFEMDKIIAQNKINNDKLSYKTRIEAVQSFYKASEQIEKNNEALQLKELPARDARRQEIEKDAANKLLQLQINRDNQLTTLHEKQYKQDQEILKNNIQAQKDLFKSVVDDPNQSFSAKKVALEVFNARSLELIKANFAEETKEAGKNAESKKLAQQNFDKATLQQANDTAAEKLKILKEELQKEVTLSKQSQQDQLYDLDQGSQQALRALTHTKDQEENALALKRAKNQISEKEFNKKLLQINDQFNIDRIAQELVTEQTILGIKEGQRDSTLIKSKIDGASDVDLKKIKSDADKDIQTTKNKIAGLKNDLENANAKKNIDDSKRTDSDKKAEVNAFANEAQKALDLAQQAEDAHYQRQIDLLEQKKQLIDDTTKAQIEGVNNSIQSEADKQRKINILNARGAQEKAKIDAQEKKIKQDQAKFDKEASIAKIILGTAVAIVNALSIPIYGEALAIVIGALGAAELAVAVATPLPKFATGTLSSPEGFAHVGERGPELRIDPSGKMSMTPGTDTITYLEKGTQIIPNHMIRPEKLNYAGGQQVPWKEVLSELRKNRPEQQKRPVVRIQVNNDSLVKQMSR